MMVTSRSGRGTAVLAAAVGLVVAACGTGDEASTATGGTITAAPATAATGSTTTDTAAAPPAAAITPAPAGVAARAELGYPRDLVDRGRFNLVVTNQGDVDLVVLSKRLDADFFQSASADDRMSIVPAGGRPVALQTLFGTVADCEDDARVTAVADLTYTLGDDGTRHRSQVVLDDAGVLDDIRAQRCTARHVAETVEVGFDDVVVDGETIAATLTLHRDDPADELAIEAIVGTVLFGAEAVHPADVVSRTARAGDADFALPLVLDVNRCDPHAVAETTKKYGLDLWVSVNGAVARQVPVPIDPLLDGLETILERCEERTR